MRRLARAFSRHEAKNKTNAYFLPKSAAEVEAEQNDDNAAAHAAFNGLQDKFHQDSNEPQNASLYVDFDGVFTSPRDVIDGQHLADIRRRNAAFMAMTHHKVSMLTRWKADLGSAGDEVAELWRALGMDALDRDVPQAIEDFKASLGGKLAEFVKQRRWLTSGGA